MFSRAFYIKDNQKITKTKANKTIAHKRSIPLFIVCLIIDLRFITNNLKKSEKQTNKQKCSAFKRAW